MLQLLLLVLLPVFNWAINEAASQQPTSFADNSCTLKHILSRRQQWSVWTLVSYQLLSSFTRCFSTLIEQQRRRATFSIGAFSCQLSPTPPPLLKDRPLCVRMICDIFFDLLKSCWRRGMFLFEGETRWSINDQQRSTQHRWWQHLIKFVSFFGAHSDCFFFTVDQISRH